MIDVTLLLAEYGLPIVFAGSVLEGESVVVLAAYAARQGIIEPVWALFSLAALGSFVGDQIYFWIGRYWGKPYLMRRPTLAKRIQGLHGVVSKYETTIMFGSRFMYGFRIALPIALGLGKASGVKYAFLNIAGSLVWASIWTSMGWYAYDVVENLIAHTKRFEKTIIIGIIVGIIIAQAIAWMRRKIEQKVEEVEEEVEKEERQSSKHN